MVRHRQTKKRFSLKDMLFNKEKVNKIAQEIKMVYPRFDAKMFEKDVVGKFPELELMERIRWIRDCLRKYLPQEYKKAVTILIDSLPPGADQAKTDNDFGDFIYAPYSYFVSTYGCTQKHLSVSLSALKEITTRFSAEGAIRDFLNSFPKETLKKIEEWSQDNHYHVRRLVSEGTRPCLPWAKKITVDYETFIPVLNKLFADQTRFVTRSVANHVNDISKIDPKLVVTLLKKWKKLKKQNSKEMQYIINHSLRTLVKQGNKDALKLLGYDSAHLVVKNFTIPIKKVKIGDSLSFSFDIVSTTDKTQDVMLDYVIHFLKANGKQSPKTFKINKRKLAGTEEATIKKKHPMRLMSTRALYPGTHTVELQINGKLFGKKDFEIL